MVSHRSIHIWEHTSCKLSSENSRDAKTPGVLYFKTTVVRLVKVAGIPATRDSLLVQRRTGERFSMREHSGESTVRTVPARKFLPANVNMCNEVQP